MKALIVLWMLHNPYHVDSVHAVGVYGEDFCQSAAMAWTKGDDLIGFCIPKPPDGVKITCDSVADVVAKASDAQTGAAMRSWCAIKKTAQQSWIDTGEHHQ
jgi:hypothetical protein